MDEAHPSSDDLLGMQAALQALAAEELPAPEAARLRARIARDPGLGAAYRKAEVLEERLRAEPLLPLPLFLLPRIMATVTGFSREPAHVRPHVLLGRVAACALLAFASWLAFFGEMPGLREADVPGHLMASLPMPAWKAALPRSLQTDASSVLSAPLPHDETPSGVVTLMLSVVGLLLLVLGLVLARSNHRNAEVPPASPAHPPRHTPKGGQV